MLHIALDGHRTLYVWALACVARAQVVVTRAFALSEGVGAVALVGVEDVFDRTGNPRGQVVAGVGMVADRSGRGEGNTAVV